MCVPPRPPPTAAHGAGALHVTPDHAAIRALPPGDQDQVQAMLAGITDAYQRHCTYLTADRLRTVIRSYAEALSPGAAHPRVPENRYGAWARPSPRAYAETTSTVGASGLITLRCHQASGRWDLAVASRSGPQGRSRPEDRKRRGSTCALCPSPLPTMAAFLASHRKHAVHRPVGDSFPVHRHGQLLPNWTAAANP